MPRNSRAATHPCGGAVCLEAIFKRTPAQKQHIASVSCCKAGAIMETKHWSLPCHALSVPTCCPFLLSSLSLAIVPHCAPGPTIPPHLLSCPPSPTAPPSPAVSSSLMFLIACCPPLHAVPHHPLSPLTCCLPSLAVFPSTARGTALFR